MEYMPKRMVHWFQNATTIKCFPQCCLSWRFKAGLMLHIAWIIVSSHCIVWISAFWHFCHWHSYKSPASNLPPGTPLPCAPQHCSLHIVDHTELCLQCKAYVWLLQIKVLKCGSYITHKVWFTHIASSVLHKNGKKCVSYIKHELCSKNSKHKVCSRNRKT